MIVPAARSQVNLIVSSSAREGSSENIMLKQKLMQKDDSSDRET
jgi:hypothetical protein